jgi:hypothetical protein
MREGIGYKYSECAEVLVAKIDWQDADGTVADDPVYEGKNTYSIVFTYKVDGHFYSGTFSTTNTYRKGDPIPVRYDPADPERNDWVVKETRQHWIVGIVMVVLIVLFIVFHMF